MGIFDIFDPNKRELNRLAKIVKTINALEPEIKNLKDDQLREHIVNIRKEIEPVEDDKEREKLLNKHLPWVFASVREVAWRKIGLRHYDVQLIAGIVLHEGRIAEQKTGEGKTLTATSPIVLNAMSGRGSHLITVNDYLARRDAEWNGPIYDTLGFSIGILQHNTSNDKRRAYYNMDIVYGTNHEYGFDYLRDNMAVYKDDQVQRVLNFGIVDEVDSILIDEARTPLIISGSGDEDTAIYYRMDKVIRTLNYKDVTGQDRAKDIFEMLEERKLNRDLQVDWDYEIDLKNRSSILTWKGIEKIERAFGITNLYDYENQQITQLANQALKAHGLMKRDVDYLVKDGQIIIIDENTGRLMYGRRFNEGLHQAIEAKENLVVAGESQTLATITVQNFFRIYQKLAGMTGTAKTEEEEFRKIYGMDVVVVPTHKDMIRDDSNDLIYKDQKCKWAAIVKEITDVYQAGQPVLVGTTSVEKSEKLSTMLRAKNIPHQVLNAKYHEREAYIVAQAGRQNSVTVSTNMAGRGTDILLGGNPEFLAKEYAFKELTKRKGELTEEEKDAMMHAWFHFLELERKDELEDFVGDMPEESELLEFKDKFMKYLIKAKQICDEEKAKVLEAGGLYVLGTERHESRRIDNQLRGRSGRQGDPGKSKFFLSLDDDLLKLYAMDRIQGLMNTFGGLDDDVPLTWGPLTRAIEHAQKKVEGRNFDIRKHVLQYDDVMNKQRQVIYSDRQRILLGSEMKDEILQYLSEACAGWVMECVEIEMGESVVDVKKLFNYLFTKVPIPPNKLIEDEFNTLTPQQTIKKVNELVNWLYLDKEQDLQFKSRFIPNYKGNYMRDLERWLILRAIDRNWIDHLNDIDHLREGIGLRGYAQVDPIVIFSQEAFDMFESLKLAIKQDVISNLFRYDLQVEIPKEDLEQRLKELEEKSDGSESPIHRESLYNIKRLHYDEPDEEQRQLNRSERRWMEKKQKGKAKTGR